MKILIVQNKGFIEGKGGTEKVCCFLANSLSKQGHDVCIATFDAKKGGSGFPLNDGVKLKNIYDPQVKQQELKPYFNYPGKNPLKWIVFKLAKKYAKSYNGYLNYKFGGKEHKGVFFYNLEHRSVAWQRFISEENPELIISMSLSTLLEISYVNSLQVPVISSVNGRPDYDFSDIFGPRNCAEQTALIKSYCHLSAVQVLFESYKAFIPDCFRGISKTIPNFITQVNDADIVDHFKKKQRYKITHLGFLQLFVKQQDLAVDCFSDLAETFPDWDMEFWGVGDDYEKLKLKIAQVGLSTRIFLKGYTKEPMEILKESSVFVFPSKLEGFPLALGEAMSLGLPCIGLASCSGVNELIQHGKTGFLAENKEEFTMYLKELMIDADLRNRLGQKGHSYIKQFNEQAVLEAWNELIGEVRK